LKRAAAVAEPAPLYRRIIGRPPPRRWFQSLVDPWVQNGCIGGDLVWLPDEVV
jgi:hypothetical protein